VKNPNLENRTNLKLLLSEMQYDGLDIKKLSTADRQALFNEYYFKNDPNDPGLQGREGYYYCTGGCTGPKARVKAISTSAVMTNKLNHVSGNHSNDSKGNGGWAEVLREIKQARENNSTLGAMGFVHCHPKADRYHRIFKTVIGMDLPFSVVENELFRDICDPQAGTMCTDTFMGLLEAVAGDVENKIRELLPKLFMLLFDCWDDGRGRHILGMFAVFPDPKNPKEAIFVLLIAMPLDDETNFKAENYIDQIEKTLEFYGCEMSFVVGIIGDHVNCNKKIARLMKKPMVGCGSHRLQLGITAALESHTSAGGLLHEINECQKVMRELKASGALRQETNLRPCVVNENTSKGWAARWKSVKRWKQLKDGNHVDHNNVDIEIHMPRGNDSKEKFDQLYRVIEIQYETSLFLQRERGVTLLDQRLAFDDLIKRVALLVDPKEGNPDSETSPDFDSWFPDKETLEFVPPDGDDHTILSGLYKYLRPNADILKTTDHLNRPSNMNVDFENGVIKVLGGHENTLSAEEKIVLRPFLKPDAQQPVATTSSNSVLDRLLKKRDASGESIHQPGGRSSYIDLSWIPPTSNIVERLFSKGKNVLHCRRMGMTPEHLNDVLLLKANPNLWNRATFSRLVDRMNGGFKPRKATQLWGVPEGRKNIDVIAAMDSDDD